MFAGKEVKVILSQAGAGKTHKLMNIVASELETRRPEEIAFVTFTRKGAEEGLRRICSNFMYDPDDLPYFRTLHSLTFHALNLKQNQMFNHLHERKFNKEYGYNLNRCEAANGNVHVTKDSEYLDFYDLERSGALTSSMLAEADIELGYYRQLVQKYEEFKSASALVDFFDCLIKYVQTGDSLPVKVALIDEAQDITALQWQVIDKAFASAEKIYIAGDENQCQPVGSKVLTKEGYKNIEDITSSDSLITFAQEDYCYYGKRNREYHPEAAKSLFVGDLVTVKTPDGTVNKFTPNHRMIVRWLNRDTRLYCVYLMKKGDWFRIGQCKLFNTNNQIHLITRMNIEKAEASWILKVCNTKEEALVWEQIYSSNYGIPQLSWGEWYTNAMQQTVYSNLNNLYDNAERLLSDVRRDINYPMFNHEKAQAKSGGTCVSLCEAVNLVPEIMAVPVYQGTSHADKATLWHTFECGRELYAGFVYSMNVPKYHTYITDGGLTVHNSIYTYSGARPDFLIDFSRKYPVEHLVSSYRIPKKVYELSKGVVEFISDKTDKPFKFHEGNTDGNIFQLNSVSRLKNFITEPYENSNKSSWYLLARNKCFLDRYTEILEDNLIPYWTSDGFFMGGQIMQRITDYEGFRLEGYKNEAKKEQFRKKFGIEDFTVPFTETNLFTEGRKWVYASYIEKYGLEKLKEMCKWNPQILVSTIHFVKGGEAENVCILLDNTRKTSGTIYKNIDEELRVLYVGVTRTKQNLFLVDSTNKEGYDKIINAIKDQNGLEW